MRSDLLRPSILALLTILLASSASAEVRKVAYPRIKVEIAKAYKPDAAFEAMRKAFVEAAERKDENALFALVAPGFVWTINGALAGDYDPGRDALHNFKVLFGFRQYGRDADGGVADGPFWSALAVFAGEGTFFQTVEDGNIVCSPIAATVADEELFEEARGKVEPEDQAADWYFILRDNTPVARAVNDKGLPVARLGQEAVPILRAYPDAQEGQPAPTPTHFEVLLPSGKSGWIAAAAALPLQTGRLCYVAVPGGTWKIAIYDGPE
jgi:hypothetical protein